jgi:hypothetical protein
VLVAFAADAGAFAALCGQDVGLAGVGVAPLFARAPGLGRRVVFADRLSRMMEIRAPSGRAARIDLNALRVGSPPLRRLSRRRMPHRLC